ncbi:PaiB family negative transcriptional regulator [Litoreibacter ponti]|uniref:PaiB family negative transcriptional regulator n=1 Tax=Litoreibacter ponti TaxID=1510457 RepID=A0A2T6BP68_9RHOB|nr:FMN-binding negative transcriptional regulator [Litoreibacter ponti]PTX57861.1 PaiB family negative transcriptional regulator [Litoreibacter ponti]
MHPNPAFRTAPDVRNIGFARERGFGTLAVNGDDGPLTSHIPFLLEEDGSHAELHLVRSNPIARASKEPQKAAITVTGPDSYISPDWYGVADQVPTWNYVAVRLSGFLTAMPQDTLHPMLDRLSAHFEEHLLPKQPWHTSKMTPDVMERMMRMIQPFHFAVTAIEGTWKLGQNKPDAVRVAAAQQVTGYGIGNDTQTLAALMLGASSEDPK